MYENIMSLLNNNKEILQNIIFNAIEVQDEFNKKNLNAAMKKIVKQNKEIEKLTVIQKSIEELTEVNQVKSLRELIHNVSQKETYLKLVGEIELLELEARSKIKVNEAKISTIITVNDTILKSIMKENKKKNNQTKCFVDETF